MTDPDLLPNGMRLGQRVQVFSGGGRQFGVMARGEVVGWQDSPTIVIRDEDGQNRYVSSRLGWEPLEPTDPGSALIRDDGQVSIRLGNKTWTMTPAQWFGLAETGGREER